MNIISSALPAVGMGAALSLNLDRDVLFGAAAVTAERIAKQARDAWPAFEVPEVVFYERLASALPPDAGAALDIALGLERLRTADLYLATGCTLGVSEAIASFEALCFADLPGIVRKHRAPSVVLEDVRQMLREKLFVGESRSAPKIAEYSGRGSLRSWFRVVATRLTLNLATRGPKDTPSKEDDSELIELADPAEGVELVYMRAVYAEELRSIIPEAFARLTVHQRLLLRQRYLDGLSIDDICKLHAVHRATVQRQLGQARETVSSSLRELLGARLGLSSSDLDGVLDSISEPASPHLALVYPSQVACGGLEAALELQQLGPAPRVGAQLSSRRPSHR